MDQPSPRYPYPVRDLALPVLRVLLGIRSSASPDAARLLRNVQPPPRILNVENIPDESPFIAVVNHYDRPGLGAWWGPMALLYAVSERRRTEPREMRFIITREWWYPGGWGRWVKQPLMRWFIGRVAKTYGMIRLPPVIGSNEYRGEGAIGIRRALTLTRGDHPEIIGMSPEGRTGPDRSLCQPPRGTGLFILLLAHETIPLLPAGISEDEANALTLSFGSPFSLSVPPSLARRERDRLASLQVMVQIGKQLPPRMWGAYRPEISQAAGIRAAGEASDASER